jgi:hypothetical protein
MEGYDGMQMELLTQGVSPAAVRAPVEFSSVFRISLGGVRDMPEEKLMETLSLLIDRLRDAGVTLIDPGSSELIVDESDADPSLAAPVATFVLEDVSAQRSRALEQAFRNARANAERLAGLAGVKLGRVVAMQEIPSGGVADSYPYAQFFAGVAAGASDDSAGPHRVASRKFVAIPVSVSLQVRFAIEQ